MNSDDNFSESKIFQKLLQFLQDEGIMAFFIVLMHFSLYFVQRLPAIPCSSMMVLLCMALFKFRIILFPHPLGYYSQLFFRNIHCRHESETLNSLRTTL